MHRGVQGVLKGCVQGCMWGLYRMFSDRGGFTGMDRSFGEGGGGGGGSCSRSCCMCTT